MLNVILLSVAFLIAMLSMIMLNVILLSVVMLSVVMSPFLGPNLVIYKEQLWSVGTSPSKLFWLNQLLVCETSVSKNVLFSCSIFLQNSDWMAGPGEEK
jgi:hypothetical protein